MSFSCPHFDDWHDFCRRVNRDCVPGQPGCVLRSNSVFAVPAEERLREREAARSRSNDDDATATRASSAPPPSPAGVGEEGAETIEK